MREAGLGTCSSGSEREWDRVSVLLALMERLPGLATCPPGLVSCEVPVAR